MERTGQNGSEMNDGSNWMRLEQPRHLILQPEITPCQIFCRARIYIDGHELRFGSSQQAADFTPNVAAGARHDQ